METLIGYELKKILDNKFGIGACTLVLVLLVGYHGFQAAKQMAFDLDAGAYVYGLRAIEVNERRDDLRGTLTPQCVETDLADYKEGLAVVDESGDLDAEALYARRGRDVAEAWLRGTDETYYGYYSTLNAFTQYKTVDGTYANELDLSVAAERSLADSLSRVRADGSEYSEAERALWESRLAEVRFPLRWGWARGWEDFATGISIMTLGIMAACITLSAVFAGEYQSGSAAVILPTRHGKSRAVWAKVIASLLFALVYYTLCAAVCAALTLGLFGAAGFDLPVQVDTIWSPYGMSMGQYALVTLAIGYLVLMGCVAVTLLISSKARGPVSAAVVPMVVIILGIVLSHVLPPVERVTALLPWNVLEGSLCESLVSYGFGTFAVDRIIVAPVLYVLIAAVCVPLAVRSFRRHQVV